MPRIRKISYKPPPEPPPPPKPAPEKVALTDEQRAVLEAQLAEQTKMLERFQREREQRRAVNRLLHYKPYAKQLEFHHAGATYRERAMMAANQVGKTTAGAAEMAMHLTGRYPAWWRGKTFDKPIRAVAGSESAELTRDGVQRLIIGNPRSEPDWGTGLLPKDSLVAWSRRNGVSDALDGCVVTWGGGGDVQQGHSALNFKSYDQSRSKWQADTLDAVWLDEEPPMDIYSEALTRISSTNGVVFGTFTPLIGMSEVCRRFLLEPSPDRISINMTIDDAEHYTQEQRTKIIAGYPDHEREARAKGIPQLGSGRIFPIAESDITTDARIFPREFARIRGLDFGWDHPFACVELAHDRDNDVIYVTRAIRMREQTPVLHSAAVRAWGTATWSTIQTGRPSVSR
jgi:phage terminase large subunit-like protein